MPSRVAVSGRRVGPDARAGVAHDERDGRIVFTHFVFGHPVFGVQEDIFTIRPDGSDARQLTHTPSTEEGSHSAVWGPVGFRIVFGSDRAGNQHVFAMNANGGGVRQITATDGYEFTPDVSPDGRLLALEHDAADFSTSGIFLGPRRGGGLDDFRQLTDSPAAATGGFDTNPDFSPDGSKIAFMRALSTQPPTAMTAIFVIGIDGRGLRQVTPYSLNAIYPRWSPDGRRLLFSSNGENHSDQLSANVYTVRPDGTRLTQLTHEANGNHAFTADWAPDGTKIVFAHATAGEAHTDLNVMDLRTGHVFVIWRGIDGTQDQDPDWGTHP